MHRVRPALLACLSTVAASLAVVGSAATPASADGVVGQAFTFFGDIVVDEGGGHVFISHGRAGLISVRDLDGGGQLSIDGMYGADGMVLSDDGSTLYAALSDADAVAAIDTATLLPTLFPTGADSCPTNVAETGGLIWFATGCGFGRGDVRALDPADGSVTPPLATTYAPLLGAHQQMPDTLFVMNQDLTPSSLMKYAVTSGADGPDLTLEASVDVGQSGQDMAFTPDGSRVMTASGAPYRHPVFLTSDLSVDGSYASESYPNAVAVRDDGMVAAGIAGLYDPDIYLYKSGSRQLVTSYEFGASHVLQPGGLAFGSARLYAVEGVDGGPYNLRVITPQPVTDLTVSTDKATYAYNEWATVTVAMGAGAGETVAIYAARPGTLKSLVALATVGDDDQVSVKVRMKRTTRFSASYSGNGDLEPAITSASAARVRAAVTGSLTGQRDTAGAYHLYTVGKRIWFTAGVSPNHRGDCVDSRLQLKIRGTWGYDAVTECMELSASSAAKAYLKGDETYVGIPMRFRTEFKGDKENLGANSGWVYAKYTGRSAGRSSSASSSTPSTRRVPGRAHAAFASTA